MDAEELAYFAKNSFVSMFKDAPKQIKRIEKGFMSEFFDDEDNDIDHLVREVAIVQIKYDQSYGWCHPWYTPSIQEGNISGLFTTTLRNTCLCISIARAQGGFIFDVYLLLRKDRLEEFSGETEFLIMQGFESNLKVALKKICLYIFALSFCDCEYKQDNLTDIRDFYADLVEELEYLSASKCAVLLDENIPRRELLTLPGCHEFTNLRRLAERAFGLYQDEFYCKSRVKEICVKIAEKIPEPANIVENRSCQDWRWDLTYEALSALGKYLDVPKITRELLQEQIDVYRKFLCIMNGYVPRRTIELVKKTIWQVGLVLNDFQGCEIYSLPADLGDDECSQFLRTLDNTVFHFDLTQEERTEIEEFTKELEKQKDEVISRRGPAYYNRYRSIFEHVM